MLPPHGVWVAEARIIKENVVIIQVFVYLLLASNNNDVMDSHDAIIFMYVCGKFILFSNR